jgi:hypothetical protein
MASFTEKILLPSFVNRLKVRHLFYKGKILLSYFLIASQSLYEYLLLLIASYFFINKK